VHPVCGQCVILLDSLGQAKRRHDHAMSQMNKVAGTGNPDAFNAALHEAQSLRMECRALRDEVERHRVQHYYRPKV
jgi:hypothetical protein